MRRIHLVLGLFAATITGCERPGGGPTSPDVIVGDFDYEEEILPFLDLIFGGSHAAADGQDAIAKWRVARLDLAGEVSGEDEATVMEVVADINCIAGRELIGSVDAEYALQFYYVSASEIGGAGGYAHVSWNASHEITRGRVVIANELPLGVKRRSVIRHEMLHAIGLLGHPQRHDTVLGSALPMTHFTEFDQTLIEMLYHPDIHTGMDRDEAFEVLRSAERSQRDCEQESHEEAT